MTEVKETIVTFFQQLLYFFELTVFSILGLLLLFRFQMSTTQLGNLQNDNGNQMDSIQFKLTSIKLLCHVVRTDNLNKNKCGNKKMLSRQGYSPTDKIPHTTVGRHREVYGVTPLQHPYKMATATTVVRMTSVKIQHILKHSTYDSGTICCRGTSDSCSIYLALRQSLKTFYFVSGITAHYESVISHRAVCLTN